MIKRSSRGHKRHPPHPDPSKRDTATRAHAAPCASLRQRPRRFVRLLAVRPVLCGTSHETVSSRCVSAGPAVSRGRRPREHRWVRSGRHVANQGSRLGRGVDDDTEPKRSPQRGAVLAREVTREKVGRFVCDLDSQSEPRERRRSGLGGCPSAAVRRSLRRYVAAHALRSTRANHRPPPPSKHRRRSTCANCRDPQPIGARRRQRSRANTC